MIKICITHNQINYGRGWKIEKEDVCDLAKEKSNYIIIAPCLECINAELRKIKLYQEEME